MENQQDPIEYEYINPEEEISRQQSELASRSKASVSDSYAKWVQEANDKLERIRHSLLGEYENKEGDWILHTVKVEIEGEEYNVADWRIMNERGVNSYINFILSWYIDKNTFMTKLNSARVIEKMKFIATRLAKTLWKNKKEWDIDFKDIEMLVFLACDIIEFALRRAEGGNEKNFLMGSGGAFTYGERNSRYSNLFNVLRK